MPPALPGSAALGITASVGRFPAILTIAGEFFKTKEASYLYGYDAVAQLTFFPVLSKYLDLNLGDVVAGAFGRCEAFVAGGGLGDYEAPPPYASGEYPYAAEPYGGEEYIGSGNDALPVWGNGLGLEKEPEGALGKAAVTYVFAARDM